MRENLACVLSQNMAFTDCMKPTDFAAEKKGIKRKNWRNRIRFLLKTNSSKSILHLMTTRPLRPTADDSEYCEENIEFWTACEEFRILTSKKEMASKANSIYEDFIKNEAPKEINLDFHTKNDIAKSLHEPNTACFLSAQRKAYSLMENNAYPRFIYSDLYKELSAAARGEGKHIKS
ncbi:Regulator of G-protein signaling 2 [Dissostichus eleginoides]|uniref:Regulator of G-protein signaling 2 n=1 Tax=Dissostichus eleginoides TaxID=100907 RepID=A0AAD9F8U3_DISEL|nr:Regulator of G-protein signaling 2 [Dissostichus eleginoides]